MWRHPVVVGSDIRMIHPGSSDAFAVSNQSGAPACRDDVTKLEVDVGAFLVSRKNSSRWRLPATWRCQLLRGIYLLEGSSSLKGS